MRWIICVLVMTLGMPLTIMPTGANDYTLGIFGNANMDDTIDELDIEYVQGIIDGTYDETELADANYDGAIDDLDIAFIEAIIEGSLKELVLLDGNGQPLRIKLPVERVIVEYLDNADMMQILKKTELVVGVDFAVANSKKEFPELSQRTNVGPMSGEVDYELILSLNPDLLLTFGSAVDEKQNKLPDVSVFFSGLYYPDLLSPENSKFTDAVHKLGYVLDAREDADDYINWHIGTINQIKSIIEEVPEEDRPRVLVAAYPDTKDSIRTYTQADTLSHMVALAGGRTIAEDLPGFFNTTYTINVDPEWVIENDPDYIIFHYRYIQYGNRIIPDLPSGIEADDPRAMKEALTEFLNTPEYSDLKAVKNNQVYLISGGMRNDATKGLIGAAYLAKLFHPQEMEMDPEELHQEYLERFLGLDYNVDETGVFLYPPLIKEPGKLAGVPDSYYDIIASST